MKRNKSKSIVSIITVAICALLAACASVPADISAEVQDDLFAESKTYNGGD